jgi:hypothetical protein
MDYSLLTITSASIVMAASVILVYVFLTHYRPFRPAGGAVRRLDTRENLVSVGSKVEADTVTQIGSCANCGARITPNQKFCFNCGHGLAIDVEKVLNSTVRMIRKTPVIILPMFIQVLASTLLGLWTFNGIMTQVTSTSDPSAYFATFLAASGPRLLAVAVFGIFVGPIVSGMYPSMVEDVYFGRAISTGRAFRRAIGKYLAILASDILVGCLIVLGAFLLVVPGLIVATWYFYAAPAIILENRGPVSGMSASKRFARNKKWSTFLLLLVGSGITLLGTLFRNGVSTSTAPGLAVYLVASLIFGSIAGILIAVMSSFTYLSYAMSKPSELKSQMP